MTDYFVDDAGDNSDGLTWAKAFSSTYAMLNHGVNPRGTAGAPFANGDKCYFGNDTVDAASYAANVTITGPASGLPVIFISSTVGSGTTVSYSKSSTRQIDTSNNAANTYTLTFDGSFALYGICIQGGGRTQFGNDANESFYTKDCTVNIGTNSDLYCGALSCNGIYDSLTLNCALDGTTARTTPVLGGTMGNYEIRNLTLTNCAYRTANCIGHSGIVAFSGGDFSGLTNGTLCELTTTEHQIVFTNCLTAATWAPVTTATQSDGSVFLTNCGPADAPTYLYLATYFGTTVSTASIYRTGGATVEGDACSWLITTTAVCAEGAPFYTPWIYGTVNSTGSKTFDLYITNDTADFTDAECWLEVEYLSTADEAIWALATDQRATITATAAAQTDDTTSTWNGTGPSFTYKQKLSVTATVNETGQFRARVAVGVASIAGSRYFYVDPKVTVS